MSDLFTQYLRQARWNIEGDRATAPNGTILLWDATSFRVRLNLLEVPKESRGKGYAKHALQDLVGAADRAQILLILTASPLLGRRENGMDVPQLVSLYTGFGFVADGPDGEGGVRMHRRSQDGRLALPPQTRGDPGLCTP